MQTTLEVRWFLKGIPPEAVQHWFKSECPKKLLTSEAQTREDRYACGDLDEYLNKFQKFAPDLVGDWAQPTLYAKRGLESADVAPQRHARVAGSGEPRLAKGESRTWSPPTAEGRRIRFADCSSVRQSSIGEAPKGLAPAIPLGRDRINLKLREGNLELKLRTEQFGIQTFTAKNDIWSGRVEQWRKFNLQQLKDAAFDRNRLNLNWIRVRKERWQKSDSRC